MEEIDRAFTRQIPDVSLAPAPRSLSGHLGTLDIVFTVLAYNAPLTVVIGLIPIMLSMGNGLGAPITFLGAGLLMLLFAVGFTAMSRHVPNAGAYYAYITVGLGKPLGLGCALMAMLAYAFFIVGTYLYAGVVFHTFFSHAFGASPLSWAQWAMVIWAAVSILGYFKISLSAKVLTVALICEVIVVFAWELAIGIEHGPAAFHPVWLTPAAITSGSVGLAVLFGVTCFAGFEATAVFREEAKNPEVTVPQATYVSIIVMACIFASAAYFFIVGYGPDAALAHAAAAPAIASLDSVGMFLGKVGLDMVSALTCTSIFACLLALHNILARYVYSLSSDGTLPKSWAAVHRVHGSPYKASLIVSLTGGCASAAMIALSVDPYGVYEALVGMAGYSLVILQIFTSLSVIVFFRRKGPTIGVWRRLYAPAASLLGLLGTGWEATKNIDLLIGDTHVATCLLALVFGALILGVLYALVLRVRHPTIYRAIGRQRL
jgi:amino acid transporter